MLQHRAHTFLIDGVPTLSGYPVVIGSDIHFTTQFVVHLVFTLATISTTDVGQTQLGDVESV